MKKLILILVAVILMNCTKQIRVVFDPPIENGRITSHFNDNPSKGRRHTGTDISRYGDDIPVLSTADGVVIKAEFDNEYNSGHYVVVQHDNGWASKYAHLVNHDEVKIGQKVKRNERIGTMGMSGKIRGPHLHFVLEKDGVRVDPELHVNFQTQNQRKEEE